MLRPLLLLLLYVIAVPCLASSEIYVSSPGGKISLGFRLTPHGMPEWQASIDGRDLLAWSPLGLTFVEGGPLKAHLVLRDSSVSERDTIYELVAGKKNHSRDHYRELRVELKESAAPYRLLDLFFRAYDDGVACRYFLPVQEAMTNFDIVRENTQFVFPGDMKAWAFQINTFHSSFEGQYLPTTLDAIPDTGEVYLPLTMQRTDGLAISITEADLTDYAGMYVRGLSGTALQVVLAPHPDRPGVCVSGRTPFFSPWRVLMVGRRPGDLIESTIIQNLSSPCALDDVSWIHPGKAIFPWWPDFSCDAPGVPSALTFENQKYYIDFASENNLEYLELEPPWYGDTEDCIAHPEKYDITRPVPELRLPELFDYAHSKHVRLFLWCHWDNVNRQGDTALALFKRWGAAGVKIDFMNRDDQEMVRWYQATLKRTAALHLMVLFHGAYKPTGLQRTYPHLLTQEGVLGNEQNKVITLITPGHTVTLPFTRMLTGPMDFTPGGFRNVTAAQFRPDWDHPMVQGTRCHQLAMFVVYESPLTMVCDDPAAYRKQPGLSFIRDVPATWDETKVIDGSIGEYIVVARRNGTDWYLGAMTDWTARAVHIPLTFLGQGKYQAEIFQDGTEANNHPEQLQITRQLVTSALTLDLPLAQGGGAAVRFHRLP